ncbi:hypothetical protein GCM10027074_00710 [Streptomyces deserti]
MAGTLAAIATFGMGFVARPLGSVLFGHIGDRHGRRPVLVTSLLLTGASTVAVGCVPTYDTIGVVAPVLLLVLRFLQGLGLGLGGEWGGAVLLTTEHAPADRRGLWSSFPQVGPALGFMLANGVMLGCTSRGCAARVPPSATTSAGSSAARSPRSRRRRSPSRAAGCRGGWRVSDGDRAVQPGVLRAAAETRPVPVVAAEPASG